MIQGALKLQPEVAGVEFIDGVHPIKVSFRDLVPEIQDTTYLTHAIYYYPAKFIPHVVRFCIKEFTSEGDWIIDPFAGSGTVGLEALLTKRNAVIFDLNYLLEHIVHIKMYRGSEQFSQKQLHQSIDRIRSETHCFIPQYSNIHYWYPQSIFEVLSRYWAGLHQLEDDLYKKIIQAALVKVSREFSLDEHRTPKLFKSKFKKARIDHLLMQNDWKEKMDAKLTALSAKYYHSVEQLRHLTRGNENVIEYYAGVDASHFQLDDNKQFDALITSPPYMQAQEYIRTSKLDLFWMGYTEGEIKAISKLEIPYRKAERLIETKTLNKVRDSLSQERLLRILNSYFDHMIGALEHNAALLKSGGKMCVFVGNPKIDGIEIETWRIIAEYFSPKGFQFDTVYDDTIKTRQLFGSRRNKNPDGMKSEYLLVLTRQ